jgi:glutaredoxin 3
MLSISPVTAMPKVTIYTTAFCPYCHSAKALLRRKNVEFSEIDVSASA